METIIITIIASIVVVFPSAFFIGDSRRRRIAKQDLDSAENKAKAILEEAKRDAERIIKDANIEAKDEVLKQKEEADKEIKQKRLEINQAEQRVNQRQDMIDKRFNLIEEKEISFERKQRELDKREKEISNIQEKQQEELVRISRMTVEDAKKELMRNLEHEMQTDMASYIVDATAKAKFEVDKKAKAMLTSAIQRCAADHTSEATISVVNLPSDDMKGRIIGREGRNIKSIETLTGIDIIIDDTPDVIVLSSFDPIRREVARIAIERLMADGRIHPGKIEEMVEKAKEEVANTVKEEGERALYETGVINLHPDLIQLLGKLRYRTSYGQNVLNHSIEVSQIAGLLAAELGLDVTLAKRAGLLHDIGKSIDQESEGTHVELGVEILRKYKESDAVINAVHAHHGDVEPNTMEAVLIQAADAVSASRPGARRETVDTYIKRLQKLEEICNGFKGVDKSYAIQAGREVRIIVKPEQITDSEAIIMARNVAKQIEAEMNYPGQIKVNVIRETRAVELAK
ncbi:MAG: ribonuclease Y [Clostridia bacterium]|nr:ribonuclease Y [Clostridia bacterium]